MLDNPASTIHLFNPSSQPTKRTYIIYFITGNPGLIEYYRDFLTHLYALLQSTSRSDVAFHVYGRSLSGFELDVSRSGLTQRNGKLPPYTVNDQIEICERDVKRVVEDVRRKEGGDVKVVLMGHSLGTYICLELVKRFTEKRKMLQDVDGRSGGGKSGEVQIAGAVLLFATVMHLAKSPGGVRTSWLFSIPNLPLLVSLFSFLLKPLVFLIPIAFLSQLIQRFMDFPSTAAHVTASFVKSPHGVEQALFMVTDEMREIGVDKWGDEVWGAAAAKGEVETQRPMLKFLFAKSDHWIADSTRDELIKARGRNADSVDEDWKPQMDIDEEGGWPHAFCIRHSVSVAEKAKGYIEEIVGKDIGA